MFKAGMPRNGFRGRPTPKIIPAANFAIFQICRRYAMKKYIDKKVEERLKEIKENEEKAKIKNK